MTPADFRAQQETARLARLALAAHRANCSACRCFRYCDGKIDLRNAVKAAPPPVIAEVLTAWDAERAKPLDMLLPCPRCRKLHVDAPEPASGWENPPHKSHLCHGCGLVWRPADVATNGVAAIATRGERDTWEPANHIASTGKMVPLAGEADRDALGRRVREIWVAFAREQPSPKPPHLVGWDDLDEPNREVDRRIGEQLFALGRESISSTAGLGTRWLDAHALEKRFASEVYDAITDTIGLSDVDDIHCDDYDRSLELDGCAPAMTVTHEQANALFVLGFEKVYVNYTDGREELHVPGSPEPFRRQRKAEQPPLAQNGETQAALVEELRALHKALPPVPWTVRPDHEERDHAHIDSPAGEVFCLEAEVDGYDGSAEHGDLATAILDAVPPGVARLRTLAPLLADVVERLERERDALLAAVFSVDATEGMARIEELKSTRTRAIETAFDRNNEVGALRAQLDERTRERDEYDRRGREQEIRAVQAEGIARRAMLDGREVVKSVEWERDAAKVQAARNNEELFALARSRGQEPIPVVVDMGSDHRTATVFSVTPMEWLQVLADKVAALLEAHSKINYAHFTFIDGARGENYPIYIIRPGGKTPHELREEAERYRDRAVEDMLRMAHDFAEVKAALQAALKRAEDAEAERDRFESLHREGLDHAIELQRLIEAHCRGEAPTGTLHHARLLDEHCKANARALARPAVTDDEEESDDCEECDGTGYNSEDHTGEAGCQGCHDDGTECTGASGECRVCGGTKRRPAETSSLDPACAHCQRPRSEHDAAWTCPTRTVQTFALVCQPHPHALVASRVEEMPDGFMEPATDGGDHG